MNDQEKALGLFRKPRQSTSIGHTADWGSVEPKALQSVIALASRKGGAVRFGYTRDGGAYAIGIYAGSNYVCDYVRPNDDIDGYLVDLLSSFEEYEPLESEPPRRTKAVKR